MKLSFWQKMKLKFIYISCSQMKLEYVAGHLIFPSSLSQESIVVDCGGNNGGFSIEMIKRYNTQTYCIEANNELLNDVPDIPKLIKIWIAVTDEKGDMDFTLSENSESNSFNPIIASIWGKKRVVKVPTDTLNNIQKSFDIKQINLLKVDIEGAEVMLFKSLSDNEILRIPQISAEFHEFLDAELKDPTLGIISRMTSIGFRTIVYSSEKFSDVLFLNRKAIRFNLYQQLWYLIHRAVCYKGV
jgi:FkbM family methyltransferase